MLILAAVCAPTAGAAAWHEGFEGPDPSWRDEGGDARHQILQQQRVEGHAHSGQRCEWLQIEGGGGSSVFLGHDVGRPRVISELELALWVRSDRSGLQLVAAIVLPRTRDPRTGRPLLTHLLGSAYNDVGRWQQLRISGLPDLLNHQLRLLRSQLRMDVDGREAYVDRLLLNVYGYPTTANVWNVWIDDLEVSAVVASAAPPGAVALEPGVRPIANSPARQLPLEPPAARSVQLAGSVLLVDGRPMLPRVIQYQGERLAVLKRLGFNAVWLPRPPGPELLDEANRLDLWLVCPPPQRPPGLDPGRGEILPPIGAEYRRVLAWDLGSGLMGENLEAVARWAEQVRMADSRSRRPVLCAPQSDLRGYSRCADLLVIDRRPLGGSLDMADYGTWVRRQPLLARPGTPVWTTVQTQPSEAIRRQVALLAGGRPLPAMIDQEQLRLLVYTAIASGSRGLLLLSNASLDAGDPDTVQRAATLELLNLELGMIEPWAAAGSLVTSAEANDPQVTGAVLRVNRARLVLPTWLAPGSQCAVSPSPAGALELLVPGTPDPSLAYVLEPGRLGPLQRKREAGGMHVTLDDFAMTGLILLAQDPLIVEAAMRRAAPLGRRGAELHRYLAGRQIQDAAQVFSQLGGHLPPRAKPAEELAAAQKTLRQCETRFAAGDFPAACRLARQAVQPVRGLQRACWELAVKELKSNVASPAASGFATLPQHWALMARVAASHLGPNRLPGGDFEDLSVMLNSGWRHYQHRDPRIIEPATDLVADAARSGSRGLRLTARAVDAENPPATIETPLLWISSPAVPVEAGQLVCIHGWVNIPKPLAGSVDGLLIVDSFCGDDLAERIDRTAGWREFTLYRLAAQAGSISVTFVLSGLGEVRLDDVSIQVLEPGSTGAPAQPTPLFRPLPPH
jgi:hypothetical protein